MYMKSQKKIKLTKKLLLIFDKIICKYFELVTTCFQNQTILS